MQINNFKIIDSIAIDYDGVYIDLHSNFLFEEMFYNVIEKRVHLKWKKSNEEWAKKEIYTNLELVFNSVSIFAVHRRDEDIPFSEDTCLDYIGCLHPDDFNLEKGFLPIENIKDNYHLVLGFESGLVIKIYSDTVDFFVDELRKLK